MKKNISINICGTIYAIDEDAYQLLENYLQSMKNYFRNEEGGDEIADDIEHRVAELLWEYKEKGMTAVNIETIKEIINKVGNPKDIDDSTHTDTNNAFTSETKNNNGQEKENFFSSFGDETSAFGKIKKNINTRRFYRNADNKMLGGICSGMAEYFGIGDVIIWRLGVLILAIICGINISLSFIPDFISFLISFPIPFIYIFIWITVPEARTPEDRLRMQGRDVNPENIREQVVSDSEVNRKEPVKNDSNATGCLKALLIFFFLILIFPLLIAFLAIILALVLAGVATFGGISIATDIFPQVTWLPELFECTRPMIWTALIASFFVIGIPIYFIVRLFKNDKKSMSTWATTIIIIVWLFALAVAIGSSVLGTMQIEKSWKYQCEKESTRNGICLYDSHQWNVLDELGWEVKELNNVDKWLSEDRSGYGGLPNEALELRRDNSRNAMSFSLSRTEHFDEGDYVLESLTEVEGRGGSIKALEGSKEVAVNDLNDKGQQLWTMDWTEGKELPIFENPDSAGWNGFAKDGREHWTYRVSKPFHHKAGDITINISADKAYMNKFHIRHIQLRKVK